MLLRHTILFLTAITAASGAWALSLQPIDDSHPIPNVQVGGRNCIEIRSANGSSPPHCDALESVFWTGRRVQPLESGWCLEEVRSIDHWIEGGPFRIPQIRIAKRKVACCTALETEPS